MSDEKSCAYIVVLTLLPFVLLLGWVAWAANAPQAGRQLPPFNNAHTGEASWVWPLVGLGAVGFVSFIVACAIVGFINTIRDSVHGGDIDGRGPSDGPPFGGD